MSLNDEMQVYDAAPVSLITGETESYDDAFFPNVIRKKELEFIQRVLDDRKTKIYFRLWLWWWLAINNDA